MTVSRHDHRRRTLIGLAAITLILFAALVFTHGRGFEAQLTERDGQSVFPGLDAQLPDARIIRVRLADLSYTLQRKTPGADVWQMIESGDYPTRTDRLAALAEGLSTLRWGTARTQDPDKFDRIGLSDPTSGGTGAYIEILDTEGVQLAELITGRRGDQLYARRPGENRAFHVIGTLPPLYTREVWLDFDIINMSADVIEAVRLTDETGESLFLRRQVGSSQRAFEPAPPYQDEQLISRLTTTGPALAVSRFAPIDVKPAAALVTEPVARHITSTFDQLEIDISAYREPDGFYITLHAIEAGDGATRAETINAKADGWAFRLTEFDWNEFTPPVRSIVARPLDTLETRPALIP